MKFKIRNYLYIIGLALLPLSASASDLTIPNTFVAGQPAIADEVNTNFSATESAVNDNHARISTIEATASGFDYAASESPLTIVSTSATPSVARSITVSAPGPGFIKVDFSAYLYIDHSGSSDSVVRCAIKTDTNSPNGSFNRLPGTYRYISILRAQTSGRYDPHIDTFGVYQVTTAGSVTFNTVCYSTGGSAGMRSRSMAATFHGNRY